MSKANLSSQENFPVKRDAFVLKLIPDLSSPVSFRILSGFIGDSPESGFLRIYFEESLTNYADVPENAIKYSEEIPKEVSSKGGSKIWILKNAEVKFSSNTETSRANKYLEGNLMNRLQKGAEQTKFWTGGYSEGCWTTDCTLNSACSYPCPSGICTEAGCGTHAPALCPSMQCAAPNQRVGEQTKFWTGGYSEGCWTTDCTLNSACSYPCPSGICTEAGCGTHAPALCPSMQCAAPNQYQPKMRNPYHSGATFNPYNCPPVR